MGGRAFWNFRAHGGGGKISMPPVVGVRIFSGTTHSKGTVRGSRTELYLCMYCMWVLTQVIHVYISNIDIKYYINNKIELIKVS